jgi:hypothetical protein
MDKKETSMHDRFAELAPWHVNGTLSEADRKWVDGYVRDHPTASAELEWYRSLQANIKAEAPVVSPEIGLDRLLDRVHAEKSRVGKRRTRQALHRVLDPIMGFVESLFLRPAYAYAAAALVVVQTGVIGALFVEQRRTEQEYSEYRSIATVPATGPTLRVSFKSDARESDIRTALVDIGGTLVGGPGQLGEYVVRVPLNRIETAAAALQSNPVVEAVRIARPAPGN